MRANESDFRSTPEPPAPTTSATTCDRAIADAARRFFDDYVRGNDLRAFPWMPRDLLTALVEDYDRRSALPDDDHLNGCDDFDPDMEATHA